MIYFTELLSIFLILYFVLQLFFRYFSQFPGYSHIFPVMNHFLICRIFRLACLPPWQYSASRFYCFAAQHFFVLTFFVFIFCFLLLIIIICIFTIWNRQFSSRFYSGGHPAYFFTFSAWLISFSLHLSACLSLFPRAPILLITLS